MTFIPWPNGVQLCFDYTTAGQNWQFCLALRKSSGAPSSTDLENATTVAQDWHTATWKGFLDSGTSLRQIRAVDMTAQGAPEKTLTSSDVGASTGVDVPLSTSVVVSKRTAKRGRSYRGRIYTGGFNTAVIQDAVTLPTALASDIANAFIALATALDASGFDVVVPSISHNKVTTNPAELNEVTAYVVDTKLDSQRRRLAGRGT